MKIERTGAHFLGDVLATVPKNSLRAGDDWARPSYNAFKVPPGFRGILELSRTLFNVYKIADMLQQISPFVRPFPLPIVSRALSFFPSPQPPTTRIGRCTGERHKLKAALRLYVDNSYRRI